jgi:hypothetical protein
MSPTRAALPQWMHAMTLQNRTPVRPTLRVTSTQLKIAFATAIVMQPDVMMAKVWASQSATRQDK